MQRQVELIGAAWGLGGPEPGCAEAAAVLAPLLVAELQRCGMPLLAGPILGPSRTERRKQLAVSRLCGLLASAVADAVAHGRLPCVLGGDHSCAGGTWTGAARGRRARARRGRVAPPSPPRPAPPPRPPPPPPPPPPGAAPRLPARVA